MCERFIDKKSLICTSVMIDFIVKKVQYLVCEDYFYFAVILCEAVKVKQR